jgi:hypothetical protein
MTKRDNLNYLDHIQELFVNPPLPSTVANLMASFPSKYNKLDDQGCSIQDHFNVWKFLFDLITYGPPGFSAFKEKLEEPEEIDCIPLTKTKLVPLHASKTGPNTPARNAMVMEEFFAQANIGDLETTVNPENTVIPVFGDLLTGQHIHSLQDSQINDVSPGKRFQAQVFCHGWFHA